ncbi:MAG: sulfatase activating formylglycine-generating enzyme [Planctomycetota bacterium]|jgi:formylglycine-generating enzyme required for sulfatase activity
MHKTSKQIRAALLMLLILPIASSFALELEGLQPFDQVIKGTAVSVGFTPIPAVTLATTDPKTGEQRETEIEAFWLSTTEITWDAYDVLVFGLDLPTNERGLDSKSRPTQPYIATDRGFGHAGYPAISISHHGAVAFCDWLSEKSHKRYRLPTELEWEYAARAGTTTEWSFGDDPDGLSSQAWYRSNSKGKTHSVGSLNANPFGLMDMYGNAAEWCSTSAGEYVLRGGSYSDKRERVSNTYRKLSSSAWNASDPQLPKSKWWLANGPFAGFRVVCEAETKTEPAPLNNETSEPIESNE